MLDFLGATLPPGSCDSMMSSCKVIVVWIGPDEPVATACHHPGLPSQSSNAGLGFAKKKPRETLSKLYT